MSSIFSKFVDKMQKNFYYKLKKVEFMENLIKLRKEKKLNTREMSTFLGIAKSTYNNWENDKAEPNIAMLKKLSDFFCVSIEYLVGATNYRSDNIHTPAETLSADEKTMLNSFRNLGPFEREAILIQIQALAGESVKVKR